jgi:hypothetical protein
VTLVENQLPAHSHSGTTATAGGHLHDFRDSFFAESINTGTIPTGGGVQFWSNNFVGAGAEDSDNDYLYYVNRQTVTNGVHSHTFTTGTTGLNQPIENRPLFYSLAYIMKLP